MAMELNQIFSINKFHDLSAINNKSTKTGNFKENQNVEYYLEKMKELVPEGRVLAKSMTEQDCQEYYEQWKNSPISYGKLSREITVSPKILEHMQSDSKYADEMMSKIKDAATPTGFKDGELLDYKVIVKDDGEIEVMACAYFGIAEKMSKNDQLSEDNDKKESIQKKVWQLDYNRYLRDKENEKLISNEKIDKELVPSDNSLLYNAMMIKFKKDLE